MVNVEWRNAAALEQVLVREGTGRRRFLVFVVPQPGNRSPLLELGAAERNFDIAVRFYDEPGVNTGLLERADFVVTGGLSKFHAASLFIQKFDPLIDYDGYLFLDGDLEFDPFALSNFLSFIHAVNLDLAQPSITRDSYSYWKMAYHQAGYLFRRTSFVEVMAPYLSRDALSKSLPTFTQSISGYGLDLVWPSLVGTTQIGVIDAFQVRHPDRVDHTSGSFYKYLKSINVDLDEEGRLILEKYDVEPEVAHSRRGYFWQSRWSLSTRSPALVSVALNAPEKKTERQGLIDWTMRRARWTSRRAEDALAGAILPYLKGNRIASDRIE